MTAVIRFPEALFRASIIIRSSIRLSLTGVQVGWTTNTSLPRIFSSILTLISPSLNLPTKHSESLILRYLQIFLANSGLALPVTTANLSIIENQMVNEKAEAEVKVETSLT